MQIEIWRWIFDVSTSSIVYFEVEMLIECICIPLVPDALPSEYKIIHCYMNS